MQGLEYAQLMVYGIPGILLGFVLGYLIGGSSSLRFLERIGIGVAVGIMGGIILSLFIAVLITPNDFSILLSIIATSTGIIFGEMMNWSPIEKAGSKSHIIFNPEEDDEEFERQLKSFMDSDS
jgi:hypothetical protein